MTTLVLLNDITNLQWEKNGRFYWKAPETRQEDPDRATTWLAVQRHDEQDWSASIYVLRYVDKENATVNKIKANGNGEFPAAALSALRSDLKTRADWWLNKLESFTVRGAGE